METTEVAYDVDGTSMLGRLAVPDGDGPRAGVLILHEGPGLADHEVGRATRLAEQGFVVLAADYHGGGRSLEHDEMMGRIGELSADPARAAVIAAAGLDVLLAEERTDRSRVAAIGYCYGGTLALELGRSGADLRAIVAFHAVLATPRPESSSEIGGSVLVCTGADDPFVPAEQRQAFAEEMTTAGVDWQMVVYGGAQHSFTNPDAHLHGNEGLAYEPKADARSWQAMLDLFGEVLS